jgi:two-component system response regulator NreC
VTGSPDLPAAGRVLPPNVVLLDDHPVVRAGVRMLLERDGLHIVAEASSLAGALALDLPAGAVDVVVADLMLKDARGAKVVAALRRSLAPAAVLVLTMIDDPDEVADVLRAGASGYLLKEAAPADLVDAVRRVAAGETYLQPSLGVALLSRTTVSGPAPGTPLRPARTLTPRELDVLRLLARGHTNAEMSSMLDMSLRTVEAHRARLLRKLGFETRAELVRYAAGLGLLQFDAT